MSDTRILAVADEEDDALLARLSHDARPYGAVISCGDLRPGYLDCVATIARAPLFYVRGNHDTDERGYGKMGGIALDVSVETVGGLRIAGLDGSMWYRDGIVGFDEREMRMRATRLAVLARLLGGIDILVTHAPLRGYGDMDDLPHRGFECLNWLLDVLKPRIMLHGHVHLDYGMIQRERTHHSGTRIINAFRSWEGDV